jgi:hypothetical protein
LAAGVLLDRAGDDQGGGAGGELEDLFGHGKVWYTGPLIVPLGREI